MKIKKSAQIDTQKLHEFSLKNDCGDLKFSIFLGPKSSDNWITYYCSLSMLNSGLGSFKEIYSSNQGSVVSDINKDEIVELQNFLVKIGNEKNGAWEYEAGNKDFKISLKANGDFYEVEASIDLFTMNPDKLSGGHGDSIISLKFMCTQEDLAQFSQSLQNWPNPLSGN